KLEHEWLVNARLNATVSGYFTHHSLNHHYSLTNNQQVHANNSLNTFLAQSILKQSAIHDVKTGDKNTMNQASAQFSLKYQATKNYTLSGALKATLLNYKFN